MIETLKRLGRVADGVRCDMAMLVLRDYIRQQWYPLADQAWFDQKFPTEFWAEAIAEVRKQRPDFSFVAEAYWDKEQQLIDLGFDLAYEKKLYDALVARDAEQVRHRISRERRVLERCLNFIENHDEPRAASLFTRADNLASAALMLSLPGSALIHEGQMEGFTEKLPVQRLRPLKQETPDRELKEGYTRLLTLTRDKVFESGRFELFETGAYGVVSFARIGQGRAVAYAGQISRAWHTFFSLSLDLTQIALAIEAGERIRVKNMMTGLSVGLKRQGGDFSIGLRTLGIAEDASFCLIEVTPE
jgi:glycosidase